MNTWQTKAGKFTDGIRVIRILDAEAIVTSGSSVQELAKKMNCDTAHFIQFANLVCEVLSIFPAHWRGYWEAKCLKQP